MTTVSPAFKAFVKFGETGGSKNSRQFAMLQIKENKILDPGSGTT